MDTTGCVFVGSSFNLYIHMACSRQTVGVLPDLYYGARCPIGCAFGNGTNGCGRAINEKGVREFFCRSCGNAAFFLTKLGGYYICCPPLHLQIGRAELAP